MSVYHRLVHCSSVHRGSVKESFQLLDQLTRSTLDSRGVDNDGSVDEGSSSHDKNLEERRLCQKVEKQSVEPLNTILARWKSEYLRSPRTTLHPRQVLDKVDEWKGLLDNNSGALSRAATTNPGYNDHEHLLQLVRPDIGSYTCIMQAVAASVDHGQSSSSPSQHEINMNKLRFVDALLDRLVQDAKSDFSIPPNAASFATVMNAWAHSSSNTQNNTKIQTTVRKQKNDFSSSKKVEELLQRMEALHEEGLPNLEPNVVVYNILLHAWAKEGKIEKIEDTLQRMIHLEIPGVSPDPVSYSTLLSAYSKMGTPEATQKADSLLHQMLELHSHGMESAKPNIISFTNVVQCYARLGDGGKAEEWLEKLLDLYHNSAATASDDSLVHLDPEWKPDVGIYNSVIQAWAKSGQPHKAERFLRSMIAMDDEIANETEPGATILSKSKHLSGESVPIVEPDSRSFNIVLSAWAKAGEAERAEAILMEMHRLHVEEDFDTRPTAVSYNTVLDSYANKAKKIRDAEGKKNSLQRNKKASKKSSSTASNNGQDSPWNRAEAILNHMIDLFEGGDRGVKPTTQTWNTGKIDEAEKVLDRMTSFQTPSAIESGHTKVQRAVVPSTRTWNTLLSSCMAKGDVHRAKQFWLRMKESGTQPDIVSYNTLLNCFVRLRNSKASGNSNAIHREVESIFQNLCNDQNVSMNHITYLAMINFWINQRAPYKAESFILNMAEESMKPAKMEELNVRKSDLPAPNRSLFHYVLSCWGEHKKPKKAEELLLKMAKLSDDHKFDLRPTTETYNRLLNCWAKSMKIESGERAEIILREMETLGSLGDNEATPDIYSYNSVLNAWANSGDAAALTRIDGLILEMILTGNPSLLPDSFSYGAWLKAIASSAEANNYKKVKEVVKTMKIHNFQPSEYIQKQIRRLSTNDKNHR